MKTIFIILLIIPFSLSCRRNYYSVEVHIYDNAGCKIDVTAKDKQDLTANKETVIDNIIESIGGIFGVQ